MKIWIYEYVYIYILYIIHIYTCMCIYIYLYIIARAQNHREPLCLNPHVDPLKSPFFFSAGGMSGATIMAKMLITQFAWHLDGLNRENMGENIGETLINRGSWMGKSLVVYGNIWMIFCLQMKVWMEESTIFIYCW